MTTRILVGDVRERLTTLPSESVHCAVTSPPYFGLRDYGVAGQIGLEPTPDEYVAQLVAVFREVRRVLRSDGTLWLNLGDSYAATTKGSSGVGKNATNKGTHIEDRSWSIPPGLKPKDLIGIPWRVAFALQADGWYLRQDIVWSKPNPMPESVKDRCTKSHEYMFLLSKSERYFFDADAIKEPTVYEKDGKRNKRSVWTITPKPFKGAHFATFPTELVEPCILAGCPIDGTVLDPFSGAGTTALVARQLGRAAIGIELNRTYATLAFNRIAEADQLV